ncbi:rCG20537, isoform CRA_b [Rattus norvegicus]|uniref:RCG20537, isoform CRA_b n=1 Tax=Rattus norvegicus TaxID=10116 RepID=A6K5K0_RAT|nr:rCG20537, isoform CRA_b [Rattus norvegicus]
MLRTQKQGRWRLRRPSERTTMSIGSGGPGIAQLHICQGQRSALHLLTEQEECRPAVCRRQWHHPVPRV